MPTETAPETAPSAPETAPAAPPDETAPNPADAPADASPGESATRPEGAPEPDQYLPAPANPETGVVSFNARQREVARSVIGGDLSDDELDFFLSRCTRTGLDPFAGQIHVWKDNGKLVIHTSIDGFRAVSERSGHLAGQRGPEYLCRDGVSWTEVWAGPLATGDNGKWVPPLAARFWVLRDDQEEWISGTATWDEFNRAGNARNKNWQDPPVGMPAHMLGKVAESLCRRRAFPNELSGVYTDDEIDTATALANASTGSDDLPSADNPLAVAAQNAYVAIRKKDVGAAQKIDRYWADSYVKKVLNTSLAEAKSLKSGALYRFEPGSPHILALAKLLGRAADKILGPDDPVADALAAAVETAEVGGAAPPAPEAQEGDGEQPPAPEPPAPEPVETPGPFTESEGFVLEALQAIGGGSVADIAVHLGISEAASLRSTVTDLFNQDLLQLARATEPGEPREYIRDDAAIQARIDNHERSLTDD